MEFAHTQVCRVADLSGDPAALGGAVTVALCGHWEHEGACRWPHHTATHEEETTVVATVRFDAPHAEVGEVRALIERALSAGALTGPTGDVTTWTPTITPTG
jgi:hypothetical protein